MNLYAALFVVNVFLLSFWINCIYPNRFAHGFHYALAVVFAAHGLISLVFSYTGIGLSLNILSILLGISIIALSISAYKIKKNTEFFGPKSAVIHSDSLSYIFAWIATLCVGLWFFSSDLLPSSMSGDPARHYLAALSQVKEDGVLLASAFKPVYYLLCGIFVSVDLPLASDQLFVLFNIFVMGFSIASCLILVDVAFPKHRLIENVALICLIVFGYHLLLLQYGTFALIFSSAFFFSGLALFSEYDQDGLPLKLNVATLFAIGVALTHAYLIPDILGAFLGLFVIRLSLVNLNKSAEAKLFIRNILILLTIVFLSRGPMLDAREDGLFITRLIKVAGLIDDDPATNWGPFVLAALIYFSLFFREKRVQLFAFFIISAIGFSFVMSLTPAASYFINRNQIVILPLLIMVAIDLLSRFGLKNRLATYFLSGGLIFSLIGNYSFVEKMPLSRVAENTRIIFMNLHSSDLGVYLHNAIRAVYSPLQITSADRKALWAIRQGQSNCVTKDVRNLLVLGTDDTVIWFGIYAGLLPSLSIRRDGYIDANNYLSEYEIWLDDPTLTQIVVIKHLNHAAPVKEIASMADVACEGDSFVIYNKRSKAHGDVFK